MISYFLDNTSNKKKCLSQEVFVLQNKFSIISVLQFITILKIKMHA